MEAYNAFTACLRDRKSCLTLRKNYFIPLLFVLERCSLCYDPRIYSRCNSFRPGMI